MTLQAIKIIIQMRRNANGRGNITLYQEILSAKRGRLSDAAIVLLFILLIFVLEGAAVLLRSIATVPVMLFQSAFVLFVIWFCIWYYKKRLVSMRYTLFTDMDQAFAHVHETSGCVDASKNCSCAQGEISDCVDGSKSENFKLQEKPAGFDDFENGSLLVENLLGYSGDFVAMIHKSEMIKLYEPSEQVAQGKYKKVNATVLSKKTACKLLFEQENTQYLLYFSPSDPLKSVLKEYIGK